VIELGYEYQVKLAIANPPCIGWTEVTHRFSMQCCPLYSNLINFDLDLNETLNNYSLSVDGYYGYNNTGTVHEWVVLSSPNQYGGPYTLEATLSNSGYEELELFNGVQSGLFYTVIHKLATPCGTSCYGQQIYTSFNRGERPQQDDAGCEFCGLFECSLFDQACVAPGGITAVEADGGILLSWPHVPNATNYVVEITLDNPSCCSVGEPTSFQIFTSKNYVFISSDRYYFDCFSYRIDAICADETIRGVEHCFIYLRQAAQSVDIPRLAPDATHAVVQVYPNPVQDQAEVNFGKVFTGSYRIVHTSGQLLESGHIQEVERLQVDFSHWPAGMYWMVIEGDEETQQFKIIKR
jgi:hypothetical protein